MKTHNIFTDGFRILFPGDEKEKMFRGSAAPAIVATSWFFYLTAAAMLFTFNLLAISPVVFILPLALGFFSMLALPLVFHARNQKSESLDESAWGLGSNIKSSLRWSLVLLGLLAFMVEQTFSGSLLFFTVSPAPVIIGLASLAVLAGILAIGLFTQMWRTERLSNPTIKADSKSTYNPRYTNPHHFQLQQESDRNEKSSLKGKNKSNEEEFELQAEPTHSLPKVEDSIQLSQQNGIYSMQYTLQGEGIPTSREGLNIDDVKKALITLDLGSKINVKTPMLDNAAQKINEYTVEAYLKSLSETPVIS